MMLGACHTLEGTDPAAKIVRNLVVERVVASLVCNHIRKSKIQVLVTRKSFIINDTMSQFIIRFTVMTTLTRHGRYNAKLKSLENPDLNNEYGLGNSSIGLETVSHTKSMLRTVNYLA